MRLAAGMGEREKDERPAKESLTHQKKGICQPNTKFHNVSLFCG
jgi:hypothetical protein